METVICFFFFFHCIELDQAQLVTIRPEPLQKPKPIYIGSDVVG